MKVLVSEVKPSDVIAGAEVWASETAAVDPNLWFLGFTSDVLGGLQHILIQPHFFVTVDRTVEPTAQERADRRIREYFRSSYNDYSKVKEILTEEGLL